MKYIALSCLLVGSLPAMDSDSKKEQVALSRGQELMHEIKNDDWYNISTVHFTPDNKQLAVSGIITRPENQNTIRFWNADDYTKHADLNDENGIGEFAIAPHGGELASSCTNNSVKLYDLETFKCEQELEGHQGVINSLAYDKSGLRLATASQDGTIKIWDLRSGRCVKTMGDEKWTAYRRIVWRADDQQLASTQSTDRLIRLWELANGTHIFAPQSSLKVKKIRDISYNYSGNVIACSQEGGFTFADTASGGDLGDRAYWENNPEDERADCIAFVPDSNSHVFAGMYDTGEFAVTNIGDPKKSIHFKTPLVGLNTLSATSDGHVVALGSVRTHVVQVWDIKTLIENLAVLEKDSESELPFGYPNVMCCAQQ